MREYIVTFTGRKFYPENPTVDMIDIRDIAHGLSQICRFAGQLASHYSVAQHSVLVSELLENTADKRVYKSQSIEIVKAGLLHDAAEAYIGDLPSPVKRCVPRYSEIEEEIIRVVFQKFGLEFSGVLPEPVVLADRIALKTEFRDLTPHRYQEYGKLPYANCKLVPVRTSTEAKAAFLNRFVELFHV